MDIQRRINILKQAYCHCESKIIADGILQQQKRLKHGIERANEIASENLLDKTEIKAMLCDLGENTNNY